MRWHLGHAVLLAQDNLVFNLFILPSDTSVLFSTPREVASLPRQFVFAEQKAFTAKIYCKSQYAYVALWRSWWHPCCDLKVRHNQVKFAEFEERFIFFSEGEFSRKQRLKARKQPTPETTADCVANSSQNVASRPSDKETRLHKKIDLLMGLAQDMAPAAKTLQEAHDASLLYDDDGDDPADNIRDSGKQEVDKPPSKRCKSYLGTHRSIPEAGQSIADLNSKVDSLVTVMTENEVMGPATCGKIASVLNNILAGGLNE